MKQCWKFLLYGVTGDLSKRKILPGLAMFASMHQDYVSVDLIGYSRSKPDESEIQYILDQNSTQKKHSLNSICFMQGEYDDAEAFLKIITNIKQDERLVIYLAVPPVVFTDLLKIFCPYNSDNIDILIEKPFGSNINEAESIISLLKSCGLNDNVHFVDHYLFKSTSFLSLENERKIQHLHGKKVSKISIMALESVGLQNRGGYFEGVGALKDMFPAHFLSLIDLALKRFVSGQITADIYNSFKVNSLSMGQYANYTSDINIIESQTDTYFQVKASIENLQDLIELHLESGKKLGIKSTEISIDFEDGTKLEWNLDPFKTISIQSAKSKIIIDLDNGILDHANAFACVLNKEFSRFLETDYVMIGWLLYQKIQNFKQKNNTPLIVYANDTWPIQPILHTNKFLSK